MNTQILLMPLLLIVLISNSNAAESSEQMVESLLPSKTVTRNIVIEEEGQPSTTTPPSPNPSISIPIVFEYGSSRLTPDSRRTLDTIARALNHPKLQAYQFLIEGHTDGKGSSETNQALSEKRAAAVRDYLSGPRHVEQMRLLVVGKGASELLLPNEPYAAANRRVKFVNVGKIQENKAE
ncbi:MAG: OmpA family protein [Proteobacteria bacterium]|nr:OmpA family protein [Pseudomonadota bacterium]